MIKLFDFRIRYIPGFKNPVADVLLRPLAPVITDNDLDGDLDDWCDAQINSVTNIQIYELLLDANFEWLPLSSQYANYLLHRITPHHFSPRNVRYF